MKNAAAPSRKPTKRRPSGARRTRKTKTVVHADHQNVDGLHDLAVEEHHQTPRDIWTCVSQCGQEHVDRSELNNLPPHCECGGFATGRRLVRRNSATRRDRARTDAVRKADVLIVPELPRRSIRSRPHPLAKAVIEINPKPRRSPMTLHSPTRHLSGDPSRPPMTGRFAPSPPARSTSALSSPPSPATTTPLQRRPVAGSHRGPRHARNVPGADTHILRTSKPSASNGRGSPLSKHSPRRLSNSPRTTQARRPPLPVLLLRTATAPCTCTSGPRLRVRYPKGDFTVLRRTASSRTNSQ